MDATSITTIIANVGFPIACVVAMGMFVKYMYDCDNEKTAAFTDAINALKLSVDTLIHKLGDNDENQ